MRIFYNFSIETINYIFTNYKYMYFTFQKDKLIHIKFIKVF